MMVEKVKLHRKAHVFDQSDPASIIRILATIKLLCDTIYIHQGLAMAVQPFFVKNALSTTLNSCMSAAACISPAAASVNTNKPLIQKKLLQFYPEVVNLLHKKFAND